LLGSVILIDHPNGIAATAYLKIARAVAQRHELKFATRNTRIFSARRHAFAAVPYSVR
jgi:hypothetical protein